ncbi:MAG: bile acid:sodium symporter family protein [Verrucomicrobiales bacterium]
MPADLLKSLILPAALMFIMFGMGMSLTPGEFKRVFVSPKAKLVGLACQLLCLPLLAFGIAVVLQLPGDLAVGLMLISACPGGATSNIITHLSRGDTALSVSLTAASSMITVFTIPLIVGASIHHFLGETTTLTLPFGKTVIQLLVVTILPVALGMWANAVRPALCRPINFISLGFLVLVIAMAVAKEHDLAKQFLLAGPSAAALNITSMLIGLAAATYFGLALPQRICISIEVGIQNGTLALAIALGMLESARIAVPAVVYSLIMFATGGLMILIFGRRAKT